MSQNPSNSIMSTRRVHIGISSAVLVYLAIAAGAFAQQPPLVYDGMTAKGGAQLFHKALDDPSLLSVKANQTAFDNYVTNYSITRLIDPKVESTKQLPEIRDRIKAELRRGPTGTHLLSGVSYDRFNELALQTAIRIALGNYKPVVRYNAVLLIGDLDKVQPTMRGRRVLKPGKPYVPALDLMLTWVGLAKAPEFIKAGMLRGIHRHARAGITGTRVGTTQAAMLALLNGKTPPGKRTAKVHAWMRRRAADVLGAMKSAGVGNKVANALTVVMRDDTEPMLVRGTAAEALGQVLSGAALNTLRPEIKKTIDQAKASGATAATPTRPVAAKPRAKAGDPFPAP